MIKKWLQNLFIEAWRDYEEKFHCSIEANRNPNDYDLVRRPGTEWTNKLTGEKFIQKSHWIKIEYE